jgi:hypothetical protein
MLEKISAFVDGDLDALERREIEQHLMGCSDCQVAAEELRAIKALAQQSAAVSPPEAMWSVIREAVGQKPEGFFERRVPAWSLAGMALAAAVLLMILGSSLLRPKDPIERARRSYLSAIRELEGASGQATPKLPAKAQAKLVESLAVVDRAIAECERALVAAPGDPDGQEMLLSMYDEKVRILNASIQAAGPVANGGR